MKHLIFLNLFFVFNNSFSQQNENMFFNKTNNNVIFYLNEVGGLTTKSKASYYRITQIDTANFNYLDSINDYFISNQKAYEANIIDGYLSGNVKSFYENGNLKYEGYYKKSKRDSIWKYYFENGAIEKVIQYKDGLSYVEKLYKKNGKEVISDGNGKYIGTIIVGYKSSVEGNLQGRLVNGMMNGAWKTTGSFGQAIEYFDKGEFIKHETWGIDFPSKRMIYSVTGYDLHENVDIIKFKASSNQLSNRFNEEHVLTHISFNDTRNKPLQYKNSINLNKEFRNDLSTMIIQLIKDNRLKSFQSILQFTITEKNTIDNHTIICNNQVIYKFFKKFIMNSDKFITSKVDDKPVNCNVYINILYSDNELIIPPYQYNEILFEE